MPGAGDEFAALTYHVLWSQADTAFVAWTEEYPAIVGTDKWSLSRAVNGLKQRLREHAQSTAPNRGGGSS